MNTTNTPLGPFSVVKHSWSDTAIYDATTAQVCILSIESRATEENQSELEDEQAAIAAFLADAPAMKLALPLIAAGVAEIRDNNMLMFDEVPGGIFPIADTWSATITAIGWERAREALAARGSV